MFSRVHDDVHRREPGFWSLDDAFGVWLAYLVEEITRHGTASETWQARLAEDW